MKALKILVLSSLLFVNRMVYAEPAAAFELSAEKITEIENFILMKMNQAEIPGLSAVIVNRGKTVYEMGFGYKDIEKKLPVTPETLFELGSTSKAFTGLGILLLKENKALNLNDPINQYLPWFKATCKGKEVELQLKHFLYQTSGVPFKTIGNIGSADDDAALENTVKTLSGVELEHWPGEKFLYATINYDVLGLVIEKITGTSYENFIRDSILAPLGLYNTYINRTSAYADKNMAYGYKLGFLAPRKYNAPTYKGNTPAGYVISGSTDIARWLKIQYEAEDLSEIWKSIIKESHVPDRSVDPANDGSSYAAGWSVFQRGNGLISHAGNNPNFSSFFVFKPAEKIGIAVMANLNSDYISEIGSGIMDLLDNKKIRKAATNFNQDTDNAAFTIFIISNLFSVIIAFFIVLLLIDFIKQKRKIEILKKKNILGVFLSLLFAAGIGGCLYIIPDVLYRELPWSFVAVWAPFSFIPALTALYITVLLLIFYFQLFFLYPKKNEKPFFPLIVLSFVSGFGNAFIVFIINEALNRIREIRPGLILYFFLGIVFYVIGQKLIRTKMVTITNTLIYEKRIELIEKILNTSFFKVEKIDSGKINASLHNDTEKISTAPDVIISGLTAIITLICCFIYLGIINFFGLLISLIIIIVSAGMYFLIGRSANKLWEKTRDIQNIFFSFIRDLTGGFKELSLNYRKRKDFIIDMKDSCNEYRKKSTKASLKFANAFVIGELLFTLVIGAVAFAFPYIFTNIQTATLRTYIFVFLYMTGPLNWVLNSIPQLLQIRISWNRINDFLKEINQITSKKPNDEQRISRRRDTVNLILENLEYEYQNEDKTFMVGPINYEFKSGEITFITGGNGSGKTTLVKLLTGLYKPDNGVIKINGIQMDHTNLGEYYSCVFSDYYLFKKMYGVKYDEKMNDIQEKMLLLRINDKLNVKEGVFNTLNLSNGQRKRIALLISYIENREIFIFDEWASDQDPEFRKFFYDTLLQDLKRDNKCVVAITHDDHYFHYADNIIKMNMGKIDE